MKNSRIRFAIIAIMISFTTVITSCGKDDNDLSDKDEKGKFSLTIDGKKQEGTKVFNGAAIGIRTISAENSDIEMGLLFNEDDFNAGNSIALQGSMSYIKIGETAAMPRSGTIKVISKSKIEIDGIFFQQTATSSKEIKVKGYISSK